MKANLSKWQVPRLRNIVPEVNTLEDHDKCRPIHMRKKKEEMKLYLSDTKERKCVSEIVLSVETQLFDKATHA